MADTLISDTGSNSLPSGLPQPVHMIFDGTNYWCFYGSSTQSSQICYRNATTPTSWGSETTASGTSFPTADARIFTVIFNSATNCILIAWYDSPNNKISYRRGIINSSAATISWGTLTSAHNNVFGATSLAGTLNSSNVPVVAYVGGSTTATLTATNALTSSFADALWATVSTFSGQYISPTVSAIFPLASGGALILYDDYHSSGGTSYLDYSTYSGSSWSTYTTLWSGTGTSRTQWGSCQISTTDIAVLGVSATNTFSFQQFNGSTWSSLTAPAWPSTPLKSPSSICLTTDGTIYYAFVIDTGGYIEVNIWDGSAWSGWQVLSTFGYDTTRTYIQAGVQTPSWLNITYTRSNGTTYELRTISFSTTPASVTAAGAATLDALTGAGAGAFLAPGSGAATLAALTGAGGGAFRAPGSGPATLAALTGAGAGAFLAPGTGVAILAALTGNGVGTFTAPG
ncbi:MAG: hypothetical protein ACXVBB_01090, partial [Isosphaeraceae bacterium]